METQITTIPTTQSAEITLSARCETLLALSNPSVFDKTYSIVKTQTDAIALQKAGEPSLLTIKWQGEQATKQMLAVIKINIMALNNFLHLKNPLSEDEIDFIAEQIVDEFGGALNFGDINIVLRDAKAGKYGKFYERLSAPDILGWFRDYYDSRLDAAYQFNLNADKQRYSKRMSDEMLRQMYDIENIIKADQMRKERKDAERQAKIDKDNDYLLWKQEYLKERNTLTAEECCANCRCCSPSGMYCNLWMMATQLSYWCNQWAKMKPIKTQTI